MDKNFKVGDIVEWDFGMFRWFSFGKDEQGYGVNMPYPPGYFEVTFSAPGDAEVRSLTNGKILGRTNTLGGKMSGTHWNPDCFKKVPKFVYQVWKINQDMAKEKATHG